MTIKAFIFDLDGTLIKSNHLHVESWRRTFEYFGHAIEADRIALEIGRDGKGLLTVILGESIDEETSQKMRDMAKRELAKLIDEQKPLQVFAGVRELFQILHERGIKSAVATSASEDDLEKLKDGSGLDVHQICDVVTNADDAEEGKPSPEILLTACEKLGVQPAQCVFIGDSIWDAQAGQNAGLFSIGVLQGSMVTEIELRDNGMRQVYPTVEKLLADLPDVLQAAGLPDNSSC